MINWPPAAAEGRQADPPREPADAGRGLAAIHGEVVGPREPETRCPARRRPGPPQPRWPPARPDHEAQRSPRRRSRAARRELAPPAGSAAQPQARRRWPRPAAAPPDAGRDALEMAGQAASATTTASRVTRPAADHGRGIERDRIERWEEGHGRGSVRTHRPWPARDRRAARASTAARNSTTAIAASRGTSPTSDSWMPVAACTRPITVATMKPTTSAAPWPAGP